jgi:hypothetical protein
MLLYNIRTHPFFLKRDFSKRLLNDEFQKFWEKKKNVKIPLSAIWLVQRDFFVYYIKSEIYFSFFTAFMIISK